MPQATSIDSFIEQQEDEDIEVCGKFAIIESILEAERSSVFYVNESDRKDSMRFEKLENTWYESFMKILVDGCPRSEIYSIFDNVSFVVFNYDRCVEHYLHNSLKNYYGIGNSVATEILSGLNIHHPYGVVGALPWQDQLGGTPGTIRLTYQTP